MSKMHVGWPELLAHLAVAADRGTPWMLVGKPPHGLSSSTASAFVGRGWATLRRSERGRVERRIAITDAGRVALREHNERSGAAVPARSEVTS